MSKARSIFGLQIAVGAIGLGVTGLALFVALTALTLDAPSSAALVEACRSFVLPQLSFGSGAALVLGSIAFAVLALAARSAVRQVVVRRRFLRTLDVCGPAPAGDATLFIDQRPQAFCAGLLRPRIYISTGALRALAPEELEAVLAHEAHHARYRDPIRILLARMLSESLFFLPVLRRLADRYAALAEIAADAAAVRRHGGDTRPLAAALLAFDEQVSSPMVGIAPERVDHLLGERPRWELPVALLAWAMVVVLALVIVAVRTAQATAHAAVSLPLIAAELCMVAMAVAPLAVGAAALLGSRRILRRRRS
jgi:beta-lactamase regulating signal transducer with metallopeptidase domain